MLHIHQYSAHILYKPDHDLYIADMLSWNNHMENKDQEIVGMNVNMDAISTAVGIPICASIEELQAATRQGADLQRLKSYIIQGWPYTKDKVKHGV